jgi:hypothetical protein
VRRDEKTLTFVASHFLYATEHVLKLYTEHDKDNKDNNKFQLYEEAGSDSARTVHCDRALIKYVQFY